MCLAVPMKIIKIEGKMATVEIGRVRRKICLNLVDDVEVGDYVIVHAGFAIQKLDRKEAEKTLHLFKEMENEVC